ncbi:MAG: efflux RND transporter periplasmic adaptor subunit [Planctomycetes bacterium]|nr:efflux RND transporter periplasmic adaptor subunit [Planctomycetota bacterium]
MQKVWIKSTISGFIIEDNILNGQFVRAGETALKMADLSSVWIHAEVYENEIRHLNKGGKAEIEIPAYPETQIQGEILDIFPFLNLKTRTIKVRIEVQNPDHKFKFGMYVKVNFKINLGENLVVPADAILDSGTKQIVFVSKEDGHFEPREVKLGARNNNYYEILSGLTENEEIVTSGTFLIDSESRLKAALSQMGQKHQH